MAEDKPEVLDSDFVLIKHEELHGDKPHVQPSRVPYSAWRSLWSEKGFKLCDRDGDFVTDPADALEARQDSVLTAKSATPKAAEKSRAAAASSAKEA